jgi:hypothetical protein
MLFYLAGFVLALWLLGMLYSVSWTTSNNVPLPASSIHQHRLNLRKDMHSKQALNLPATDAFGTRHSSKPFERLSCAASPDKNHAYPKKYNLMSLLTNWNTDNTDIPSIHYDSLCHFDYSNPEQLKQAYAYRDAEVPFVVYNVPEVDAVVKKWSNLDYLQQRLGMYSSVTYYTMSVSLSNVLKLTTLTKLN